MCKQAANANMAEETNTKPLMLVACFHMQPFTYDVIIMALIILL